MTESKQNRLEWLPEWQKKIIRKYPILYLETSPEHSKDAAELPDGLLERGQRTPGLDVAERIASAFGMKLSQIVAEAERTAKNSARGSLPKAG